MSKLIIEVTDNTRRRSRKSDCPPKKKKTRSRKKPSPSRVRTEKPSTPSPKARPKKRKPAESKPAAPPKRERQKPRNKPAQKKRSGNSFTDFLNRIFTPRASGSLFRVKQPPYTNTPVHRLDDNFEIDSENDSVAIEAPPAPTPTPSLRPSGAQLPSRQPISMQPAPNTSNENDDEDVDPETIEALSDLSGLDQRSVNEVESLNKKLSMLDKAFGFKYRAYCTASKRLPYVLKRYTLACETSTSAAYTEELRRYKPMALGPKARSDWFRRHHGISWPQIESLSVAQVREVVAEYDKKQKEAQEKNKPATKKATAKKSIKKATKKKATKKKATKKKATKKKATKKATVKKAAKPVVKKAAPKATPKPEPAPAKSVVKKAATKPKPVAKKATPKATPTPKPAPAKPVVKTAPAKPAAKKSAAKPEKLLDVQKQMRASVNEDTIDANLDKLAKLLEGALK